eukprot:CAMPEP_0179253384 /NCGR_PEP_ID=MMETSP0797-20121207/22699_1 /TAXON_ID=47934 /ORGANISM="Dinophysis acuminata, Strain DAEP01" /LENGTH=316 /DNA_ID=CAMNT_0020961237 /DNA_START=59 /DNA_END=1006 /DNA_ORIENTATION=-
MAAALGGSPLLPGHAAELPGHTLHAEICRAVLARDGRRLSAEEEAEEEAPHPELNTMHEEVGTALHWAVAQGAKDAALALLRCRHFRLVNSPRRSDGSTALHIAAAGGLYTVVEALLEHPGFNSLTDVDKDGFTALHGAAYLGHTKCALLLLAARGFDDAAGVVGAFDVVRPAGHWAEAAAKDYDLRTALHMAAAAGHADIIDLILTLGPPVAATTNATNRVGATALHIAARGKHTAACGALLKCPHFTAVNVRDTRGYTALHWAAEQSTGDICAALLAREDFAAVETKDLRGRTAMEIANHLGHHEVRRLIVQRL